ncbi:citrate/2-methylcitrate synthase [Kitasatospora arboriphila]|uniref:citrate synthase (unknown stereospecificity) n=1 Tax=Kitasatospora arboriphila TaxID=258052 RepID=A0ABN1U583_9ACTN
MPDLTVPDPTTPALTALDPAALDPAELIGRHTFDEVWGILVDGRPWPGLGPGEPLTLPVRHGDVRVDTQNSLAGLGPAWGLGPLHDIGDEQAREDLERATTATHTFVAQSVRGLHLPAVPHWAIEAGGSAAERFLLRWRGTAEPQHVRAVDAYWCSVAVHPVDTATTTARLIASTGADVATCLSTAVAAMAGPRHRAVPAAVLRLVAEAEHGADVRAVARAALVDGEALPLFAAPAAGPAARRARALRAAAVRTAAPRDEAAARLEEAVAELLAEGGAAPATTAAGPEYWAAVLLDSADVPVHLFTALAICGRTADWSAHILDQKRTRRPVPTAA